ncbi:MAG: SRPBCC family protein [Acidimicrobiales bacterium]
MAEVRVSVRIDAPAARVWRALCDPAEVWAWDGARPYGVPVDYPRPGQHARWRVRLGRRERTLHDRVRAVEPHRRLAARITYGPVDLDEEYRLVPLGPQAVELTSANVVRARWPLGRTGRVEALTREAVEAALGRLKAWCENDP